jgi:hypothetical protein
MRNPGCQMSIDYLVIFCLSNLHDRGCRDDQLHLHLQRIRGIVSAALAVFPEEGSPPPSSTADVFYARFQRLPMHHLSVGDPFEHLPDLRSCDRRRKPTQPLQRETDLLPSPRPPPIRGARDWSVFPRDFRSSHFRLSGPVQGCLALTALDFAPRVRTARQWPWQSRH